MSRIEVDDEELAVAAGRLGACVEVARQVHGDARQLSGDVADCGHDDLAAATDDFLDRWAHGMGVLADDGAALARLLRAAVAGYRRVDEGIATAAGGDR